jgi:hypothetical protein
MKAIVIEDRGTFGPALVRQLEPLGVQARWIPHPVAADLAPATWASVPLVLLDALDLSSQQDDRSRSRLTSLDVLESVARGPPPDTPRVVVYSTHMAKPEVNIPLRGARVAAGYYEVGALIEHLSAIVTAAHQPGRAPAGSPAGRPRHRLPGQVPEPVPADWLALHPDLPVCADVVVAHQLMRTHPRTWRQVWDPTAAFDKAAQVWVRRNVLGALGAESASYNMAIEVVRKLAGLPYQW